jgi:Secretion system C-terminal sorting domain
MFVDLQKNTPRKMTSPNNRRLANLFAAMAVCFVASRANGVHAQTYIAQPYYAENIIRFYDKVHPVADSPFYVLDVSKDLFTAWGDSTEGINDVVISGGKIFLSYAAGGYGGALVYNFADVYPVRTGVAPTVIKPGTSGSGLPTIGMAVNPSNGDLYLATAYTGGSEDAGVYTYLAAASYLVGNQFASFFSDSSVASVCANLAFDTSGNLWMTTFNGDTVASHNYLICYKGLNKYDYYSIVNAPTKIYSAKSVGDSVINVHLLSAPEGIAFDRLGNLWLGNNNDDGGGDNCNLPGQGTLVKLDKAWIDSLLSSPATGLDSLSPTYVVPPSAVTVHFVPNGKLGGLMFDQDTLYINDQGQDQGGSYMANGVVWKYNATAEFDSADFRASGIHTIYPGNGGMAITNASFPLVSGGVVAKRGTGALEVAPNPVAQVLHYEIAATSAETFTVSVADAAGRVVAIWAAVANSASTFNVSALPPGTYVISAIGTKTSTVLSKSFVKQ